MAKGDDAVTRKRNKARRKKLQNEKTNVSARIASIIAAKKRRQSGKRRKCQGMCFSLPTPDDPFNDRNSEKDFKRKDTKKIALTRVGERAFVKGNAAALRKKTPGRINADIDDAKEKNEKLMNLMGEPKKSLIANNNTGLTIPFDLGSAKIQLNVSGGHDNQRQDCEKPDCPSKFLILCLNAIEKALRFAGTYNNEEDKPLFVNLWGVEFLKGYSLGKDMLDTSGSSCTFEKTAWIASIAADAIARKEKEGLSFTSPFLIFLVPSQEKAAEVRLVCKPLKALGIHTVSLRPAASLDHQIHGLKSCEPEFLVSTPKRLLELVSLKAIDISGVSFLVFDGLESLCKDGCADHLKSIRQSVTGNPHTLVFNNFFNQACVQTLQNLLLGSIYRLSIDHSIQSQSACIVQRMSVCSYQEQNLSRVIQVLQRAYDNQLPSQHLKVLCIIGKDSKPHNLVNILETNGYSVSTGLNSDISDVETSPNLDCKMERVVSVMNEEHISTAELGSYDIVILPYFVRSIDKYTQILTRMARHTINGILYSFLTEEDALLAGPLIQILEQCGEEVPEALRNLHHTSSMMES